MSFKPDAYDQSRYGETWEEEHLPDPKAVAARVRGWVKDERELTHTHWTLDVADTLDRLIAENERLTAALASTPAQAHPDDLAVDAFAAAMKDKLAKAREKGRGGWQTCPPEELSRMLREHVDKGDPRDVANFAMFLWSLGHGIGRAATPAPAPHPVDCVGLALDLEARAKTVESQTTQRAMEAAAHGLRLFAAAVAATPEPAPLTAIREVIRISDRSHPAWDEVKVWLAGQGKEASK